jgi:hypothetical protein
MEAAHAVVTALANAVEAMDSQTERHCQRLALLASRLGQDVGMAPAELDAVAYGALLHDVGKIGVRESILSKPAPLDEAEWDEDAARYRSTWTSPSATQTGLLEDPCASPSGARPGTQCTRQRTDPRAHGC